MFSPWLIYECTTRLPWHKLSQTWMLWIYVERLGNKFIHFFMSFVIIFFLLFPFNADIFWRCIASNLMWKIWLIENCFFFWLQGSDRSSRWTSCGTQEATKCISITCLIKTCIQGIENAVFLQARERKLTPCFSHSFCCCCTYLQFNNKISYAYISISKYLVNSF